VLVAIDDMDRIEREQIRDHAPGEAGWRLSEHDVPPFS
jgi:hypothetical protein